MLTSEVTIDDVLDDNDELRRQLEEYRQKNKQLCAIMRENQKLRAEVKKLKQGIRDLAGLVDKE